MQASLTIEESAAIVGGYLDRILNCEVPSVKTFTIGGKDGVDIPFLVDMYTLHHPKLVHAVPPEKAFPDVVHVACATEDQFEKHLDFLNFPPGTHIFFGEMRFQTGDIQGA
jgi:hypothetical protein